MARDDAIGSTARLSRWPAPINIRRIAATKPGAKRVRFDSVRVATIAKGEFLRCPRC
jgi:hypothetical protein